MTTREHEQSTGATNRSDPVGLRELAADRQVFRPQDLARFGMDPDLVRQFVKDGLWIRLHHGVYADDIAFHAAQADPKRLHLLLSRAALLALPGEAYTLATTANVLLGAPLPAGLPTAVTLVRPMHLDQRSLRRRISTPSLLQPAVIRRHRLAPADVTKVDGVPTVVGEIAAVTAAAECTPEWAVALLDAVAWKRPDVLDRLPAIVEDWTRLPGIGTVRRALPHVRCGAQTPIESLSRVLVINSGLPEPELQVPFYDASGLIGYTDMAWKSLGVIGECDGLVKYTDRDVVIREKLREDRLRALGYIVVRWTWDELIHQPALVIARIRRAIALAAELRPGRASA